MWGPNGGGFGFTANANVGKGETNGQSTTYRLSHIGGLSGHTDIGDGKTLLNGAQILGKSIEGNTRDLEIHSPQGTMDYQSRQNALSGNVLYGYGVSVNLDYQNTRVDAHEKTVNIDSGQRDAVRGVQESGNNRIQALTGSIKQNDAQANSGQDKTGGVSGFYAGDDGYRIHNTGTTVLGGLITSTAKAEAEGKNHFSTDRLVREEIHNYSNYKGQSIALGVRAVLGGKTLGQEQDERFINVGDSDVGKTFGIGREQRSQEGVTIGSVNTANLTIGDDAGQRLLTGESAAEAAKNANRGITLEHVKERNGTTSVSFDADKVIRDITSTAQVMQGFDGTIQGIKRDLRKQAETYRARGDEETAAKLDKLVIGVDMLKGGLTPADSALGTIANTAAPLVSYQIGQYAKAHGSEGSAGHIAAHAALAALTSAANGGSGTDMATSAAITGAAEYSAPLVAKGFYGTSDSSKLTAEQKETISNILGLAAAGAGAAVGNSTTAYGASRAAGNAIDDNFLGMEDKTRKAEIIDKAYKYRGGAEKYFEDHPDDSQELVEIFRKDADSDNLKNTMESGKPLSEFEYYQLMAYGMDARAQDMRAQQKDKTVVMGDYQFLFQTPVPLKPGTAVMNNDLSFVTRDNREVLKRLDKINKLPQEERRFHREELSYLHAYTNLPGNGYLKNAYKAPAIDQNLKLTNDTLAATAGVVGAAALAETAPAQMAMAGYGGWQIGDGSRDIYQGKYKEGTKKLFWGGLDVASVGVSRWTRAGKLGTIATDTTTAYRAVDTNWNSIAYSKSGYDKFRAGKNTVFGAAEYTNTGKLAFAEYLDNSKYAAGALKTVDNTASGVAKINKAETVGSNTAKLFCSFRGDMQVKTRAGYQAIASLQKGDSVYSKDEKTGNTAYKPVTAHYQNDYAETVYLTLTAPGGESQTIVSNTIHPFLAQADTPLTAAPGHDYRGEIKNAQWVEAAKLRQGYRLLGDDKRWHTVHSVRIAEEPLQAYNLTVADYHTYFIKGEKGGV